MQHHAKRLSTLSSDPPPLSLLQEPMNTPSSLWVLGSDEFNDAMTHPVNAPRQSERIKTKQMQMQMGQLKMGDFSKRINTSSNSNCSDPELRKLIKAFYPSDPPPDQINDASNGKSVTSTRPVTAAIKQLPSSAKGKSMRSFSKQQKILSNSTNSDNPEATPPTLDCPAKRTRRNVPSGDTHALTYDNLMAGEISGEHVTVMNGNVVNSPPRMNGPYDYTIQTRSMANAVVLQHQQQHQYFALQPVEPQPHQGQWTQLGGYTNRGSYGIAEHQLADDSSRTCGSTLGSVATSRTRESSHMTEGSVTRGKNGRMLYPKTRKRTTEAQRNDPVWQANNEKANASVRKWRGKKKLEDEAKDMLIMNSLRLLGPEESTKLLPPKPTEDELRVFNKFIADVFPRR